MPPKRLAVEPDRCRQKTDGRSRNRAAGNPRPGPNPLPRHLRTPLHTLDVSRHLGHRLVSPGTVSLETLSCDAIQCGIDRRDAAYGWWRGRKDTRLDVCLSVSEERTTTREHFIEDNAQAEYIRAGVEGFTAHLLRRHIRERAQFAAADSARFGMECIRSVLGGHLRQP